MASMSPTKILKEYFGQRPGTTLKDFADELKELSTEDKDELVRLAATELGIEVA